VLTEDLHIVEPCGGYLCSPLALPFELCLRLEFFNAIAAKSSTPTSVFDLAQWDTARFFLHSMGAVNDHGVKFNESTVGSNPPSSANCSCAKLPVLSQTSRSQSRLAKSAMFCQS
jgi:hypothetical protein